MRADRKLLIACLAATWLIWGSTYLFIKLAIHSIPPLLMAGGRQLSAGILLYAWARRREPAPPRAHWGWAALIGTFLFVGGNGTVTFSEQSVPTGVVALLVAMVPLWLLLLNWGAGGARPRLADWAGLALGFAGVAVLVHVGGDATSGGVPLRGAAILFVGTFCWALGSVISKRSPIPTASLAGAAMEMIMGGIALFTAATLRGEWAALDLAAVTPGSWASFWYLSLVGSVLGFSAYKWLLAHATPAQAGTYAFVNPVVAVLCGWAFLGEPVGPRLLTAMVLVSAAVALLLATKARTVQADPAE